MVARKLSQIMAGPSGLDSLFKEAQFINRLNASYQKLVSPGVAQGSRLIRLDQHTLVISAHNSSVAAKLRQCLPTLLEALQQEAPLIHDIRIKLQFDTPGFTRKPAKKSLRSSTPQQWKTCLNTLRARQQKNKI